MCATVRRIVVLRESSYRICGRREVRSGAAADTRVRKRRCGWSTSFIRAFWTAHCRGLWGLSDASQDGEQQAVAAVCTGGKLQRYGPTPAQGWAYIRYTARGCGGGPDGTETLDVDVCDESGHVCVRFRCWIDVAGMVREAERSTQAEAVMEE